MKELLKKLGPGDVMYYVGFAMVVVALFTNMGLMLVGMFWMILGERAKTEAMSKRLPPVEDDPHA